ncbi:dephospho-CoA kinase [Hirschia litorea]|uniref:Dephospho-CoA kinase n=1 Tax=Hirschia litorea TaxID=1199156 RepID=A0ABW2IN87_9PROT
MIILGLTGSIGMGKSTTANMFKDAGIPVYDSDASVHALYGPEGEATKLISADFPNVTNEAGGIDRTKLGLIVLKDDAAMKRLEAIVHPLVFKTRQAFVSKHKSAKSPLIVFDVPLLFETGSETFVDKVLVVTAPQEVQLKRVLERKGMTEEKFKSILKKQMPDTEKRSRADFIIDTSLGIEAAQKEVNLIIKKLTDLNTKNVVN